MLTGKTVLEREGGREGEKERGKEREQEKEKVGGERVHLFYIKF